MSQTDINQIDILIDQHEAEIDHLRALKKEFQIELKNEEKVAAAPDVATVEASVEKPAVPEAPVKEPETVKAPEPKPKAQAPKQQSKKD